MSHDADIAQKNLIKETRGSYEAEKIFRQLEKLVSRMDSMQQATAEMQKDIQAIKGHLGIG
jgi:DNA anti-recombination protein RmuC